MITVCMFTYNQEHFIAQALESVLKQQLTVPFQILISDDASSDNTTAIIKSYITKHPEKICLIERRINIGAQQNFVQTLKQITTPYIALLDGDDYWNSEDKLQIQFNFLEKNPHYVGCASQMQVFHNDSKSFGKLWPKIKKDTDLTAQSLIWKDKIPSCTAMFRNKGIAFSDSFLKLTFTDWTHHLFNSLHGPFRLMALPLSTYRVHSNSIWSAKSKLHRLKQYLIFYTLLQREFPKHQCVILFAKLRLRIVLLGYSSYHFLRGKM